MTTKHSPVAMRGLVTLTTRLASALALLAIVAGIPIGLWRYVGWPLPRTVPTTWAGWEQILTSAFPDAAVVNLLAVALWIVWAAFTYSVCLELAAVRRGRAARRVGLISPMQALAAILVAGLSVGPAAVAVVAPAPPPPVPAATHAAASAAPAAVQAIEAATAGHGPAGPPGANLRVPVAGRAAGTIPAVAPAVDTATADLPRFAAAGFDGVLTVSTSGNHYTVTVHRHDTLWDIADAWLGDPHRWPEIYQLNRDRYDEHGRMHHGDHIEPGWILVLPDDARPPAGAQPAAPPQSPGKPPACVPAAPTTPSPAPSTPASPAPTTSAQPGDDGLLMPTPPRPSVVSSPSTATAPTPSASAAAGAPAPTSAPDGHRPGLGVDLAEHGWVAAPVAAAVAAAATLVWIQRRRRYRPHPPTGARRDDPDLTPPPRTIATLHRARPDPTPDIDADDAPADLPVEAREALTVTQTALGTHADRPLRLPDLPPLGVGLIGSAAHHAARGVLAAVLSSGGPWAASDTATLVTTAADLVTLLGEQAPDRFQMSRLRAAPDLDDALTYLERQLLRRARLAADHPDGDLTGVPGQNPNQPLPPIVLLTTAPTGRSATRLAAILAVGSRLAITGVLLGPWTTGTTWRVNPDGSTRPDPDTTGAAGPRLNILDTTATADILDTLRQARPDHDDLPPPPARPTAATRGAATPPHATPTQAEIASPAPQPPTGDTPAAAPAPPGARLRLRVLGKPTIQLVDGHTSSDIRIRRSDGTQILVYLAVHAVGATSDELIAALWPELRRHPTGRHSAGGRFYTAISELRQALDDALGVEAIPRAEDKYRLDPQHIDVDLWQLTTAVDQAATTVDPEAHTRALRDVIALYTGHLADGHSWLWLAPDREAIRRHVLDAYTRLADAEPDPRAAMALIQDAIRLDPYDEDLYQRAMRLHALGHNADGIRRTLGALRERLAQLDIDISPQTQQHAADLLAKLDARHRKRDDPG